MSTMEEDTELRDLLIQSLHSNGVLGKIKAQLRSSVFMSLEGLESDKKIPSQPTPRHKDMLTSPDTQTALKVVVEFLKFFDLEYTLNVLQAEALMIKDMNVDRMELAKELNIHDNKDGESHPLLYNLLKANKLNNMNNSMIRKETTTQAVKHNNVHEDGGANDEEDEVWGNGDEVGVEDKVCGDDKGDGDKEGDQHIKDDKSRERKGDDDGDDASNTFTSTSSSSLSSSSSSTPTKSSKSRKNKSNRMSKSDKVNDDDKIKSPSSSSWNDSCTQSDKGVKKKSGDDNDNTKIKDKENKKGHHLNSDEESDKENDKGGVGINSLNYFKPTQNNNTNSKLNQHKPNHPHPTTPTDKTTTNNNRILNEKTVDLKLSSQPAAKFDFKMSDEDEIEEDIIIENDESDKSASLSKNELLLLSDRSLTTTQEDKIADYMEDVEEL